MYVKKFTSFCQVLKRCTQKKFGSFVCLTVYMQTDLIPWSENVSVNFVIQAESDASQFKQPRLKALLRRVEDQSLNKTTPDVPSIVDRVSFACKKHDKMLSCRRGAARCSITAAASQLRHIFTIYTAV